MKEIPTEERKKIMLNILCDFAQFCDEHHLRYFLTGGTLLGCVRHRGFIPWDDDIDVGMPRYDYEKFIEIYNSEKKNPNLFLYCPETVPDMYIPYGKVCDTRTQLKEAIDSPVIIGENIDILPLDNIGDTRDEAEAMMEKDLELRHDLFVSQWKIIKERSWYKNIAVFFIKTFSKKKTIPEAVKEIDTFCRSKEAKDTSFTKYVSHLPSAQHSEIYDSEWFESFVDGDFEGMKFKSLVERITI